MKTIACDIKNEIQTGAVISVFFLLFRIEFVLPERKCEILDRLMRFASLAGR
jgi:hypothetical protein